MPVASIASSPMFIGPLPLVVSVSDQGAEEVTAGGGEVSEVDDETDMVMDEEVDMVMEEEEGEGGQADI